VANQVSTTSWIREFEHASGLAIARGRVRFATHDDVIHKWNRLLVMPHQLGQQALLQDDAS
jgi:hypothetical protein